MLALAKANVLSTVTTHIPDAVVASCWNNSQYDNTFVLLIVQEGSFSTHYSATIGIDFVSSDSCIVNLIKLVLFFFFV